MEIALDIIIVFIDIILRHAHVATVARVPFWWSANVHSHMHKDRKLLSYSSSRWQIHSICPA